MAPRTKDGVRRDSRGFGLVELMVAIVLGLVLMAGVIQVFIGNRQAQRADSAVSRVQESGRVALELITADLRAAGFYGCPVRLSFEKGVTAGEELKVTGSDLDFISATFSDSSVRGYEHPSDGVWSSPSDFPAGWSAKKVAESRVGSDVLAVYYGEAGKAKIRSSFSSGSDIPANIGSNNNYFTAGDAVIVSNCKTADVFRITNTPGGSGDITISYTAALSGSYDEHSMLMRLIESVYFVGDTGRKNPAGNPIFSLYRMKNDVAEELVEGVEFLQILYGEQMDSGAVRFVSADDASLDASRIVSVRVGVLAQSYDEVGTGNDKKSYALPGETIDSETTDITHGADKTIRRVFSATVELRNRMRL